MRDTVLSLLNASGVGPQGTLFAGTMTYAVALADGNGSYPWENLRWELALRMKKPACASMISQKLYGSYTLAPILLPAGIDV